MGWKETHRRKKLLVIFWLMDCSVFSGVLYNLHIFCIYSLACINYVKKEIKEKTNKRSYLIDLQNSA